MAARKPLTPAQRAAATQRQALYRERQKITKANEARIAQGLKPKRIPKAIAPKRPATYRPPSARTKTVLGGRTVSEVTKRSAAHARYRASQEAAQRASDKAIEIRNNRASTLRLLPQARNKEENIFAPDEGKRKIGEQAEAAKIRKGSNNQRLQAVGRRLRRDAKEGSYDGVYELLETSRERIRFREATRRIAAISPQALAIYFHNEGGSGELTNALKAIRYPVDGGDADDGLKRLEQLAGALELADETYGEKAIAAMPEERRLELGADERGRLNL